MFIFLFRAKKKTKQKIIKTSSTVQEKSSCQEITGYILYVCFSFCELKKSNQDEYIPRENLLSKGCSPSPVTGYNGSVKETTSKKDMYV
jgi:SET domain-containing protein